MWICEDCYQLYFKKSSYSRQAPPPERHFEEPSEIVAGKVYLGSCYSTNPVFIQIGALIRNFQYILVANNDTKQNLEPK